MSKRTIRDRIKEDRVIILDGGMGAELKRRGLEWKWRHIWSANALLLDPDMVRVLHEDYLSAGAEVIKANTYDTHRANLDVEGLGAKTEELNQLAVNLAKQAIENVKPHRDVWIAGCMSHLRHWESNVQVSPDLARVVYEEQAELLAQLGVDLLLVESLARLADAVYATEAASNTGLPTWVGIGADAEGKVTSGEPIAEAVKSLTEKGAEAILIHHTPVEHCTLALKNLLEAYGGPTGVYAESGTRARYQNNFASVITLAHYLTYCQAWKRMGARILGGCCGIGPEHIREIAAKFRP